MAFILIKVLAYKCTTCKKMTITSIPDNLFDIKEHKKSCDICGRDMQIWEMLRQYFVPEDQKVLEEKTKACGREIHPFSIYICLFYT